MSHMPKKQSHHTSLLVEKRNLGNLAQRVAIMESSELNENLNIKEGNSLLKWWCEQHRDQMNILPIV